MDYPGGFWIRALAIVLDILLISAVVTVFILLFNLDTSDRAVQTGETALTVLYFVLLPILWHGYTVGKRIAGVRIVKVNGGEVTFVTMLLRYVLGLIVYGVTAGIGFLVSVIMVAVRKDKRALHDFIAGTYVTKQVPEKK